MGLFSFRTRNPARDSGTDRERFARLIDVVRNLRGEMEGERDGLRARYDSAAASAAFAQDAFENDGGQAMSGKVDDLTGALMRYHARLAELDEQIEFMTGLDEAATGFANTALSRHGERR